METGDIIPIVKTRNEAGTGNQTGILTININVRAQEGVFNKTVFFKTNAGNDVELIRIVGTVKK